MTNYVVMGESLLISQDYKPAAEPYPIQTPEIPTGETYYFITESGLKYQVRFGKKRDNYLGNIVNFSVLSEEFEDEYSETNRGEVYRVISTVIEIIRIFHEFHKHSDSYEFTGEFKDTKDTSEASIRTRLYFKYANMLLDKYWRPILEGNKVTIKKIK